MTDNNVRDLKSDNDDTSLEPPPLPVPPLNRFQGSIVGCAVGDAVGAWAERRDAAESADYVKYFVSKFNFKNATKIHGKYKFGQYTDDTQLTRELTRSIVNNGGFDPEDFASRVASIFAKKHVVGSGGATREAAKRLHEGVPWDKAGTPLPRSGNGGAMRAAPIGCLHWNDVGACLKAAHDQAIVTHTAPMSVAGACTIAVAVAMALNASGRTSHPGEAGWWGWLARFVDRESTEMGDAIRELTKRHFSKAKKKEDSWDDVLAWLLEEDDPTWEGISPYAKTSVLWACYAVMRNPKDFWATIMDAIRVGGDVDSTAAMAGAISGAYLGLTGIPSEAFDNVAMHLHDAHAPEWGLSKLLELVEALHKVATADPEPEDEGFPEGLQGS